MSINKETVKKPFTEWNFVALLLPLLCQNGVFQVEERELEEKLFSYYKNKDFKELFQEIVPTRGADRVNLYSGLYTEKYIGGNLWFEQMHSNILNLTYDRDMDLSSYEQYLSEDGKLKIRQMALELAKRYKAEQNSKVKLNIFGVDPNCSYSLVCGKHVGRLLSFELITDGDISSINYEDTKGREHVAYDSPLNPNEAVPLKDNTVLRVTLENATYAIKQGLCNGKIRYCNVNTQILDDEKLKEIVNIANQRDESSKNTLTSKAPYVRKIILR